MRFLFVDRILEAEPGKRLRALKVVSVMDEYLTDHYAHRPIVPPTMVFESLAQTGGWLNLLTWNFQVKTILVLADRVRVHRRVLPGEPLVLDASYLHAHRDGASIRAAARVGADLVMTVDQIVFAHEVDTDPEFIRQQHERFHYLSGIRPLKPGELAGRTIPSASESGTVG